MAQQREGGCQCGTVRYRIRGEPLVLGICHCKQCQRQSGSAFGMSLMVRKEQFELLRGELKAFTRSSDSGHPVVCSFCPDCGTRIVHEPKRYEGMLNVKAGTLDDTTWLRPSLQSWTSSKQPWLVLGQGLMAFEGQPERR